MPEGMDTCLNLSVSDNKDDAPLNLSLKPATSAPEINNSLSSLTNITVAVGNSSNNLPASGDRVCEYHFQIRIFYINLALRSPTHIYFI